MTHNHTQPHTITHKPSRCCFLCSGTQEQPTQPQVSLTFLWGAHLQAKAWLQWKQAESSSPSSSSSSSSSSYSETFDLDGKYMQPLLGCTKVGMTCRAADVAELSLQTASQWTVIRLSREWIECICNCQGQDQCTGEKTKDRFMYHPHRASLPRTYTPDKDKRKWEPDPPYDDEPGNVVYFVVPSAQPLPQHLYPIEWPQKENCSTTLPQHTHTMWQGNESEDRLKEIVTDAFKNRSPEELREMFDTSRFGMARVALQELLADKELMEFLQQAQEEVTKHSREPLQIMYKHQHSDDRQHYDYNYAPHVMFACPKMGFQFMHVDCGIAGVVYSWLLTCNWATGTKFHRTAGSDIQSMLQTADAGQTSEVEIMGAHRRRPIQPGTRHLFCSGTTIHGGNPVTCKEIMSQWNKTAAARLLRDGKVTVFMGFIRAYVDKGISSKYEFLEQYVVEAGTVDTAVYYSLAEAVLDPHSGLIVGGAGPCSTEVPITAYEFNEEDHSYADRRKDRRKPKPDEGNILDRWYKMARALRAPNLPAVTVTAHTDGPAPPAKVRSTAANWFQGISFRVLSRDENSHPHARIIDDAIAMGIPHEQISWVDNEFTDEALDKTTEAGQPGPVVFTCTWGSRSQEKLKMKVKIPSSAAAVRKKKEKKLLEDLHTTIRHLGTLIAWSTSNGNGTGAQQRQRHLVLLEEHAFLPSIRFWKSPPAEQLDETTGVKMWKYNQKRVATAYPSNTLDTLKRSCRVSISEDRKTIEIDLVPISNSNGSVAAEDVLAAICTKTAGGSTDGSVAAKDVIVPYVSGKSSTTLRNSIEKHLRDMVDPHLNDATKKSQWFQFQVPARLPTPRLPRRSSSRVKAQAKKKQTNKTNTRADASAFNALSPHRNPSKNPLPIDVTSDEETEPVCSVRSVLFWSVLFWSESVLFWSVLVWSVPVWSVLV